MAMAIRPSLIERAMQREAGQVEQVSPPVVATKPRDTAEPAAATTDFELNPRQLHSHGLLSPRQLDSPLGRQISSIKRNLLRRLDIFDQHDARGQIAIGAKHSVLVTSPGAHDGKTFMTLNLALNLALEDGLDVLLIDADLRASHLATYLGIDDEFGLTTALADPAADPQLYVRQARSCPLKVILAGPLKVLGDARPNIRELAKCVRQLVDHSRHSVVLVDAPPLLLTTEAPILADCVDETLLVVNAGVSDSTSVDDAIDLLDDHDHLSIVLNRCRLKLPATQYKSYYGSR